MGRKPTRWTNLPRGMRARPRGKLIHYYLDTGEKPRREIPLGSDYVLAVQRWAELTSKQAPVAAQGTFAYVAGKYWVDVIPSKALLTQRDNEKERDWLLKFFNDPPAPLDNIQPVHIRQYLDWRVAEARKAAEAKNAQRVKDGKRALPVSPKLAHVRANREKALFSHIWNYARSHGYTSQTNPCTGIKGFREAGRDVYVDDALLDRIMVHAGPPLAFALKLAHLTGQRPSDVLRMSEAHLVGGVLNVRQGKTQAKLRIVVQGALADLLEEIKAYKAGMAVHALSLLVNEGGRRLTAAMLRKRFDQARDAAGIDKALFQFRDLRAKAATDSDDEGGTRQAQGLLGHTTETMTANYIRHKAGKKVTPLR